ncbi:SufE family protein [Algiphilus sp.]|uniref:SufE family protein n=1 Tax=Algiphilus sp. TaxID=1872431 RepID=UPI003B529628
MDPEELIEDFEMLGDWEERYRYLIELGSQLPPLSDEERTEENKVRGCMSQVWLVPENGSEAQLRFRGDSDAHIVRGLIALLRMLMSERDAAEVRDMDIGDIFSRLGLENQITANRRNGFYAMVQRIKQLAEERAAS